MAIDMREYFHELSHTVFTHLHADEVLLLNYDGEDSDFARLNNNKIRQAGYVRQQQLALSLVRRQRQHTCVIQLSGDLQHDIALARDSLVLQRDLLALIPEDPNIYYATEAVNTHDEIRGQLPDAQHAVSELIRAARGLDIVGIWASGEMSQGFANSFGQFNWHTQASFNADWSVYLKDDKAVKQNYAGNAWCVEQLESKLDNARATLAILQRPVKSLSPGHYRAFLTPASMREITDLLAWSGFGLKSHRAAQTPLIKMVKGHARLNDKVTMLENHGKGLAPRFTRTGFIMPDQVVLIENGEYKQCLAGARSAKEYNEAVNSNSESPVSLHVNGGGLRETDIFKQLDCGIYVSNLWYCNFSDRNLCRITGMTRFASLWVEHGEPVAPISVMRFDESLYQLLGDNLIDLSEKQEHLLDAGTYDSRSHASALLPGALVSDFSLTL